MRPAGLIFALCLTTAGAAAVGETGRVVVRDLDIPAYFYRPGGCKPSAFLFVFHGTDRNASAYRDRAVAVAEANCFVVYAPEFGKGRFSNNRYHRGGVAEKGRLLPVAGRTVGFVPRLVQWARGREGLPAARYYLFGHSAGAQFLSRVAAYAPPDDAAGIIVANASSYVVPSADVDIPYGFRGLPAEMSANAPLRKYLEVPMILYLGGEDMGARNLHNHPDAKRLGATRFARGKRLYALGKALAEANGWAFNWRLAIARGVGHSSTGMLDPANMADVLRR
jgi:dienelactone hydrolase